MLATTSTMTFLPIKTTDVSVEQTTKVTISVRDYKAQQIDETHTISIEPIKIQATTISVSSLKITWAAEVGHSYSISCIKADNNNDYNQNIRLEKQTNDLCYITGLRENTSYNITVRDLTNGNHGETIGKTETVNIIQEYEYIPGWTNCFAYESAAGLTKNPSKSAIKGAIPDPVTGTGIMRNEYGDYCVAMGLYYGECGDRFLVELENGTQFTVKICDSKGYGDDGNGVYHEFGYSGEGKCLIEFIHGDYLPHCVTRTGSYGAYEWDGLLFDNIKRICRIDYGNIVTY